MRRTKSEAEQTRNSILDAALTLFDEQGYTQTTLSSVARKAGVTRGAIYWHFENKDEILVALTQEQFHDLMQQNADAMHQPDSWDSIGDNLNTFFQQLIRHPVRLRFFRVSTSTAAPSRSPCCTATTNSSGSSSAMKSSNAAKPKAVSAPTPIPITSFST